MPRNCDNCGIPLVPILPEYNRRKDDKPIYQDALRIDISGGYGGYIDEFVEPFIICDDCANAFFHTFINLFSRVSHHMSGEQINNVLLYEKKDD